MPEEEKDSTVSQICELDTYTREISESETNINGYQNGITHCVDEHTPATSGSIKRSLSEGNIGVRDVKRNPAMKMRTRSSRLRVTFQHQGIDNGSYDK